MLITKATADSDAAHALARASVAAEVTGFHAQQAVEKATKAVLVLAGVPIPHTHDLERLLALAAECGCPPPRGVASAAWQTPWGVQFRYDEIIEDLDQDAALDASDATRNYALPVRHPAAPVRWNRA